MATNDINIYEWAYDLYMNGKLPDGWYLHGRRGREHLFTGHVIQCSFEWETALNYSGINGSIWLIYPKKNDMNFTYTNSPDLIKFVDWVYEKLVKGEYEFLLNDIISANYNKNDIDSIQDFLINEKINIKEIIKDEFTPRNIVDSAQAFDNEEWIDILKDYNKKIVFVHTPDGGIIMDQYSKGSFTGIQVPRSKEELEKLIGTNNNKPYYEKIELNNNCLIENHIIKKGSTIHLEELTLDAFRVPNIISSTTQNYKDIRKDIQGTANKNTKFILSEIENNDIIFKFLLEATEMYDEDHIYYEVDPVSKEKKLNSSKTYELQIKMLDVLGNDGWLEALKINLENITGDNIKELFDVADIQWWVSDPSFLYQGFQYWLTQLDSSIYPENRKPKRWDKIHGDGQAFTTKHMAQVIDQLPFFRNQMSSSLTSLLRDKGYIAKRKHIKTKKD